jgi:hypothetical protein
VERVDDPEGPFHGRWYVAGHSLDIDRTPLVNKRLYPKVITEEHGVKVERPGDVYTYNKKRGHAADVDRLRRSVQAHENIHIDLVAEEHAKLIASEHDPIRQLEAATAASRNDLQGKGITIVTNADEKLKGAELDHAKVKARMRDQGWDQPAALYLPDGGGGWELVQIPSLALLGDD